ncbi:MAG: choice-of-anchor J domain-containing protein [Niabella sp.]|nr:choice-of-anchor J domain-containing protein [Niabella sp.]
MTRAIKITGLLSLFMLFIISCDKNDYPKPVEKYPTGFGDQSFTQGFSSVASAQSQGWIFNNLSDEAGTGWAATISGKTGYTTPIAPMAANNAFLFSSFLANGTSDASGYISNWVISPKVIIQNGDQITFYAKSSGNIDGYGDRLQLRMNIFNTSAAFTDSSSTDVGNFTTPLLDINATYSVDPANANSFSSNWTKYTATISGLNHPDSGRVALRYFVQLNGGTNGDAMALDSFAYKSAGH